MLTDVRDPVTLSITGFVPNLPQGEETLLAMRLLASAGPWLLHLLAIAFMLRFTLDEAPHRVARQQAANRAESN